MKLNRNTLVAVAMMFGALTAVGCKKSHDATAESSPQETATPAETAKPETAATTDENGTITSPGIEADVNGVRYARPAPPAVRVEVRGTAPSSRHVWRNGYWRWDTPRTVYVWERGYWEEDAVYAPHAPPAVRYEDPGYAPSADYYWSPGYWRWGGREYVWVYGRWDTRRYGYDYVTPRWEYAGGRWAYRPGRWSYAPYGYAGRYYRPGHNDWGYRGGSRAGHAGYPTGHQAGYPSGHQGGHTGGHATGYPSGHQGGHTGGHQGGHQAGGHEGGHQAGGHQAARPSSQQGGSARPSHPSVPGPARPQTTPVRTAPHQGPTMPSSGSSRSGGRRGH